MPTPRGFAIACFGMEAARSMRMGLDLHQPIADRNAQKTRAQIPKAKGAVTGKLLQPFFDNR
ncbi:hypothetical protein [Trichothermofontia sp.]